MPPWCTGGVTSLTGAASVQGRNPVQQDCCQCVGVGPSGEQMVGPVDTPQGGTTGREASGLIGTHHRVGTGLDHEKGDGERSRGLGDVVASEIVEECRTDLEAAPTDVDFGSTLLPDSLLGTGAEQATDVGDVGRRRDRHHAAE